MPGSPHFHVGILVPNIEQAIEELSTVLGANWTEVLERPAGQWQLRVAFTRDGPPFIELIEGPPDSPWASPDGPRMHHLGWWAENHAAERKRLGEAGLVPELDGETIGITADYYVAPRSGLRLELVGADREVFAARWGLTV
jgi:hypothetical protein